MIEIISYQSKGVLQLNEDGTRKEVERFQFCCWESLMKWLKGFDGLNKCEKCQERLKVIRDKAKAGGLKF